MYYIFNKNPSCCLPPGANSIFSLGFSSNKISTINHGKLIFFISSITIAVNIFLFSFIRYFDFHFVTIMQPPKKTGKASALSKKKPVIFVTPFLFSFVFSLFLYEKPLTSRLG